MSKTCFLLALMFAVGRCQNDIYEWAIQVMEKDRAYLTCEDGYSIHKINTSVDASNYGLQWKLPTGKILNKSHNDDMFQVKQGEDNGIDGYVLEIKSFKNEYKGAYICMITDKMQDDTMYILRGVNMHDRRYKTLTEKYERNIIVAVVSSLVFIVPFLGSCLLYRFRWQTEEERAARKARRLGLATDHHDNNVMFEVPRKTAADSVEAADGGGAYDNPIDESNSTQL